MNKDDWFNLGFDAYFEDDKYGIFFAGFNSGAVEGKGYRDFRKGWMAADDYEKALLEGPK